MNTFAWMMFEFALRLDETWPEFAFSGPLISAVYVAAFGAIIALLAEGIHLKRDTVCS